jgi:Creatinine amidohydrolase
LVVALSLESSPALRLRLTPPVLQEIADALDADLPYPQHVFVRHLVCAAVAGWRVGGGRHGACGYGRLALRAGFRRFLLVNGHGGNTPAASLAREWMASHADGQVIFHSWWDAPEVREVAASVAPDYSHANWGENFPWTRLAGVELPAEPKADAR